MKTIYLAGGCFWGVQKYFDQWEGVTETAVGYANGTKQAPSYEEVCTGMTGAAETVKIVYDETVLSTEELLRKYFLIIDPLSVNKQGNDTGTQYRTGIYYEEEALPDAIKRVVEEEEQRLGKKLATEVCRLSSFYDAEEYHQKYLEKNPGGYCHIGKQFFKELSI